MRLLADGLFLGSGAQAYIPLSFVLIAYWDRMPPFLQALGVLLNFILMALWVPMMLLGVGLILAGVTTMARRFAAHRRSEQ